jgi:hypothetical protein
MYFMFNVKSHLYVFGSLLFVVLLFPFAPKHVYYCKGRNFVVQLHCATRWKVADSIPDGVTLVFH